MKGKELDYTEHMLRAYSMAINSPDPSTQNGAVLLGSDGEELSVGWNDFPAGISDKYWHGDKQDKYDRVVHAEVSAILDALTTRDGRSHLVEGGTLICPWAACSNCAKHIAEAGIATLVRHTYSNNGADTGSHWYADCEVGNDIFREAGVKIVEIEPITSSIIKLRRNGGMWPS